jgi:Ulp1 family protease
VAIITFYARALMTKCDKVYVLDANAFDPIFAAFSKHKDKETAYENCKGVMRFFPYGNYEYLIMPVLMEYHWTFAVIQNPKGRHQVWCEVLVIC